MFDKIINDYSKATGKLVWAAEIWFCRECRVKYPILTEVDTVQLNQE